MSTLNWNFDLGSGKILSEEANTLLVESKGFVMAFLKSFTYLTQNAKKKKSNNNNKNVGSQLPRNLGLLMNKKTYQINRLLIFLDILFLICKQNQWLQNLKQ